jgi:hypothetical protein
LQANGRSWPAEVTPAAWRNDVNVQTLLKQQQ